MEWKLSKVSPSHSRRGPLLLEPAERRELERRVLARMGSQQAAYRAAIILRAADRQTDEQIARDLHLAVRTVWEWRRRFAQQRLAGLEDRPKHHPPRQYRADIQAQLVVLACQKAVTSLPTGGRTHHRRAECPV